LYVAVEMSLSHRILSFVPYLVGCAIFWNISKMPQPPVPDALQFEFSDKIMHAIAYGCLAGLAAIAIRERERRALLLAAALLSTGYGIVDEIHQSFVPGRQAGLDDVIADAIGAFAGAWLSVKLRDRFAWLGGRLWIERQRQAS
jgi:VanZ family protein